MEVEAQGRGRVDPELAPDIAATVVVKIVFGLNHLAVKDLTFDLNAAVNISKLLLEGFEVSKNPKVEVTKTPTDTSAQI